jgi:hypothetical protein
MSPLKGRNRISCGAGDQWVEAAGLLLHGWVFKNPGDMRLLVSAGELGSLLSPSTWM